MTQLTGTGLAADDLYLLAHHDVTGRPYLQRRALGFGLAGALLAELVLAGSIRVLPRAITVTGPSAPAERLARQVLGVLTGEYERLSPGNWLMFLAVTAEQNVARRLEEAGYLARVARAVPGGPGSGSLLTRTARSRRCTGYRPCSQAGPRRFPMPSLAGLAAACGLGSRLLPYGPPDGRRNLDDAVRLAQPDLRELIAQTQAAVDSAVLAHRV